MTKSPTEAVIYLADQRGLSQAHWYRSSRTFKSNAYRSETDTPSAELMMLNDDVVKGGHTLRYSFDEDTVVLLLPVVGTLISRFNAGSVAVEVGQSLLIPVERGEVVHITNPWQEDLINFISVAWRTTVIKEFMHHSFDLENPNQLTTLQYSDRNVFSIGKFAGRADSTYKMNSTSKGVMVLALEGAFEVQNRLLHPRDALALWNTDEIEFEALSQGAILLIFETAIA